MKSNTIYIVIIMTFFFLPMVSAWDICDWIPFWWCEDDETGNILTARGEWTFLYENGLQEEYFDWVMEDTSNPSNERKKICLLPKVDLRISDPIIQETRAYLRRNGIDIGIVEPSDMEVETEGGNIKKMCVDVDAINVDYIRFGEESTTFVFENETLRVVNEQNVTIQDVILYENTEQCLVNCYAKGRTILYNDSILFEDFDFRNNRGQLVNINDAGIYLIKEIELNETIETWDQNCTDVVAPNSTVYTECNPFINGTENITKIVEKKELYDFSVLPVDSYDWVIEGNKNVNDNVDWAVSFQGFETDTIREYWAWWNSTWSTKREISNLTGEYPTINISYYASMKTDFGDIRFLDETETNELNYTIRSKEDSEWIYVTVDVNNASSIYMYYGNNLATETNSTSDTFGNPESFYSFDGNANDLATNNVMVENGDGVSYSSATKIIGESIDFDGTDDFVNSSTLNLPSNGVTISYWIKPDTKASNPSPYGTNNQVGGSFGIQSYFNGNTILINVRRGIVAHNGEYPDNTDWIMITDVYNTSGIFKYNNGKMNTSCTSASCKSDFGGAFSIGFTIGGYNTGTVLGNDFNGKIDEFFVYESSLIPEDVHRLYTMSDQTSTAIIGNAVLQSVVNTTNIEPVDNFKDNDGSIYFNCTCETSTGCIGLNLTVDNILISSITNSTPVQNLSLGYTNSSIPDGSYDWYCTGYSVIDSSNSSTFSFSVDSTNPSVLLTAPQSEYGTLYNGDSLNLNYTISDTNLDTCSYYYPNRTLSYSGSSGNNFYNFTSHSASATSGDLGWEFFPNHLLSNSSGGTAEFSAPSTTPNCDETDYNSIEFIWDNNVGKYVCVMLDTGQLVLLNITSTTTFDYNLFEMTGALNCSGSNKKFNYSGSVNNVSVVVTDSYGNVNTTLRSWTVALTENDNYYVNETLEGNVNLFWVDVSTLQDINSANLIYNGTSYSADINQISSNRFNITKSLRAPDVSVESNLTFYWEFGLSGGSTATLRSYNQTVTPFIVDNCSNGTVLFLNFTHLDEELQNVIANGNSSIQLDLDIYPVGETDTIVDYSYNATTNNPQVCLSENLSTSVYEYDLQVIYGGNLHVFEKYHLVRATLSEDLIPSNINLYDLLTTDSTEFLITLRDSSFNYLTDAQIYINRKYVDEGVFKTVEIPLTDDNGNALGHFDTDKGIYTIVIVKNGVTLGSFDNIAVVCQDVVIGDCDLNLNLGGSDVPNTDYDSYDDVSTNWNFNQDSREVTVTYAVTDSSTPSFILETFKYDAYGNVTVCNDTLTSGSGTLICTVPEGFGNITIVSKLYKDGTFFGQRVYSFAVGLPDILGDTSYVYLLILIMTIPLMFTTSTVMIVVGTIVGFMIASFLMIFNTGDWLSSGSALVWLIVTGGIIIWKITRRVS